MRKRAQTVAHELGLTLKELVLLARQLHLEIRSPMQKVLPRQQDALRALVDRQRVHGESVRVSANHE